MIENVIKNRLDCILKSFPEISSKRIKVVFFKENCCMLSQPSFNFIFMKNNLRRYKIIISNKQPFKNFINSMSIEELDGWIAHEVSHLLAYEKMTNLELLIFGYKYFFYKKFKKNIEKETDMETIRRGFSKELIAGNKAVVDSNLPKQYKKHFE
jgi:hypothetical protein